MGHTQQQHYDPWASRMVACEVTRHGFEGDFLEPSTECLSRNGTVSWVPWPLLPPLASESWGFVYPACCAVDWGFLWALHSAILQDSFLASLLDLMLMAQTIVNPDGFSKS